VRLKLPTQPRDDFNEENIVTREENGSEQCEVWMVPREARAVDDCFQNEFQAISEAL
jgi:hypothetical protein